MAWRWVGCSRAEIGANTGHGNAEVTAILEAHDAATDPRLAGSAIRRLESAAQAPNCPPNRAAGSGEEEEKTGEDRWLGNLDSNQDRRSQSPLFYR